MIKKFLGGGGTKAFNAYRFRNKPEVWYTQPLLKDITVTMNPYTGRLEISGDYKNREGETWKYTDRLDRIDPSVGYLKVIYSNPGGYGTHVVKRYNTRFPNNKDANRVADVRGDYSNFEIMNRMYETNNIFKNGGSINKYLNGSMFPTQPLTNPNILSSEKITQSEKLKTKLELVKLQQSANLPNNNINPVIDNILDSRPNMYQHGAKIGGLLTASPGIHHGLARYVPKAEVTVVAPGKESVYSDGQHEDVFWPSVRTSVTQNGVSTPLETAQRVYRNNGNGWVNSQGLKVNMNNVPSYRTYKKQMKRR